MARKPNAKPKASRSGVIRPRRRRLLRGARRLSLKIYGDEDGWRSIATLAARKELPIWRLCGGFVAFEDALDDALAAKERAVMANAAREVTTTVETSAAAPKRAGRRRVAEGRVTTTTKEVKEGI